MGNLAKWLKSAAAVAAGAAAQVLEHYMTEGSVDFSPQHMRAAGFAAFVALLLYLARSPREDKDK